ncbi:MAG: hypothetical protein M0Q41_10720 [Bacteroidales bacterium]|nr:hypothetical protein [Acholeplasmataceae bacterium]MCK9449434.1 hypothetical protein [Bacteroidales bacterium]
MARRNKVKLKERDPYKFHRNTFWGLKIGRWASIFAPFLIVFIVKFNEYFVEVEPTTSKKMTVGAVLLLVVAAITIFRESKEKGEDGKLHSTSLSRVIGWGVAFAIAFLFQTILKDLTLILGVAFGGQAAGFIFELFADNQHFYMLEYKKENIRIKAHKAEEAERQPIE